MSAGSLVVSIESRCPSCGGTLRAVLPRYAGPVPVTHTPSNRRPCWLIVEPDPAGEAAQEPLQIHTFRAQAARDAALEPTILKAMEAQGARR